MQKLMSYNVLKHQKMFPADVWTNTYIIDSYTHKSLWHKSKIVATCI